VARDSSTRSLSSQLNRGITSMTPDARLSALRLSLILFGLIFTVAGQPA
jgi:hypothetical protein